MEGSKGIRSTVIFTSFFMASTILKLWTIQTLFTKQFCTIKLIQFSDVKNLHFNFSQLQSLQIYPNAACKTRLGMPN